MNESIKQLIRNSLVTAYSKIKDLKANDDGSNTFKVVASTSDVDRAWDSLEVDKWDATNFWKNPAIQADHNYLVSHIVWKATKLYKEWKKLILEWIFTDITEYGRICKELYNAGFLKAVSVGFITHRDKEGKVLSYELLEVSFVAIPCHPDAISTEWKELMRKGLELWIIKDIQTEKVSASDLKEWDIVTYRYIQRETVNWKEEISVYPNKKILPNMGKILQKLESNEEVMTWNNEIIVGKSNNPIFTIQDFIKSKEWPRLFSSGVMVREFNNLEIERIVTKKELDNWFKEFNNEPLKNMNEKEFNELKEEVTEIKSTLNALADGKAVPNKNEDGNSEIIKTFLQDLNKNVSEKLCQIKKTK